MTELKYMTYTKVNGDISKRNVIVVSRPKKNYLVYDVTNLTNEQVNTLLKCLDIAEEQRQYAMSDFELLTGISEANLWRSFKPEGIEWDNEET